MSTEKKRSTTFRKNVPSLLFLPLLCRTNLYRTIRANRERNGGRRKKKKKEMTVSSAFLQFSIFFPSFLLPSFLSACSFFFYPQRAVLTPSHSISDCFLSLNHCSFLIVLVRVGEVPSAREVEEECARMERNRGNWGVMRTT